MRLSYDIVNSLKIGYFRSADKLEFSADVPPTEDKFGDGWIGYSSYDFETGAYSEYVVEGLEPDDSFSFPPGEEEELPLSMVRDDEKTFLQTLQSDIIDVTTIPVSSQNLIHSYLTSFLLYQTDDSRS